MLHRLAIAEDEPLSIQLLTDHLSKLDKVDLVLATDNLNEIEWLIRNNRLDLVLMDINIRGARPGHVAELLKTKCRFIIITAYPISHLKGIQPGPNLGFLNKPVGFFRLRMELVKVLGVDI